MTPSTPKVIEKFRPFVNYSTIGADLDGTLINWGEVYPTVPNEEFIKNLKGKTVYIITNQGGIPKGNRTPENFILRVKTAIDALKKHGAKLGGVYISLYHPSVLPEVIEQYKQKVDKLMKDLNVNYQIYTSPDSRKPGTLMLKTTNVPIYVGDEPTDEEAAIASGIKFYGVNRFVV